MEKEDILNSGFVGLGIDQRLLEVISQSGFTTPTPIQLQSIPESLKGTDVFGVAQTGTGKTLAFGVPMVQALLSAPGLGLVVLPTRELAIQVEQSLLKLGRKLGVGVALLIGGEPMGKQLRALRAGPRIVIATPGRLVDHLQQKTIKLSGVKVLVLDEADRMLEMGFAPQLKAILDAVPTERQTLLFSATMPDSIVAIATSFMKMPIKVEVAPSGTVAENIEQEVVFVNRTDKLEVLKKILLDHKVKTLVFTKTKHGAKKLTQTLLDWGISAAEIHSNRTLKQRLSALEGFKGSRYNVLVATDIAARGIDARGIGLVINFDLPSQVEDYVHRIGRTGRAGQSGKAVSIATIDQRRDVLSIERLIGQILPRKTVEGFDQPKEYAPKPFSRSFGSRRVGGGRSFGSRPHSGRSKPFRKKF